MGFACQLHNHNSAFDEARQISVKNSTKFTDSWRDPYRYVYKAPGLEFAFYMLGCYEERKHLWKGEERIGGILAVQYIIESTIRKGLQEAGYKDVIQSKEQYIKVINDIKDAALAMAHAYDTFNLASDFPFEVKTIEKWKDLPEKHIPIVFRRMEAPLRWPPGDF